ncbi:MAG: hypothetical protein AABZ31_12835 [Bdellovibrionota bacterium]
MKNSFAAWPLVLICALTPLIASHLAWVISIAEGHIPDCIPYVEGCTSISRAARYGLGNHLFRFLMLPTVLLQALLWLVYSQWLKQKDPAGKAGTTLPYIGITAALFLGLYTTFLGTEGEIYQFLRRSGVTVYFGATYLAQMVVHHRMELVISPKERIPRLMFGICVALLPLALISTLISAITTDPQLKDRLENIIEWNLSLLVIVWILLFAFLWRRLNIRVHLST